MRPDTISPPPEESLADPPAPPVRTRPLFILLLKLTIAGALITFLLRSDQLDLRQLGQVSSIPHALLALASILAAFLVSTIRWHGLLRSLEVHVTRRECLRISWLGLLGSQVLPGVTGGDLVRGASIARSVPTRRLPAILSVVIDRGIGLVGLLMIGTVALTLAPAALREDPVIGAVTKSIAAFCAVGLAGLAFLAWPGSWRLPLIRAIAGRIERRGGAPGRLLVAMQLLGGRYRAIAIALGWSLLAHGLTIFAAATIAHACFAGGAEAEAGLSDYALLVPVGQLSAALPIAPGGVGVSEWVYESLFARLGVHHGAELSLWLRALMITTALGALPIALASRRRSTRPQSERAPKTTPIPQEL